MVAGAAAGFLIALAAFQLMGGYIGGRGGSTAAAPKGSPLRDGGQVPKTEVEVPLLGLTLLLPASWRPVEADVAQAPIDDAPVVAKAYGDPDIGTVLTIAASDATGRASFRLWLGMTAPLMMPVGTEPLPNAMLGGTPAWLLWRPEADGHGALYGAYLERDERYISLIMASKSPATDRLLFRDALTTSRWAGAPGTSVVPELPIP